MCRFSKIKKSAKSLHPNLQLGENKYFYAKSSNECAF